jgi:hypothetical protein
MGEVAQFTGGKVPAKLKALAGDNTDLSAGVQVYVEDTASSPSGGHAGT